MRMMYTKKRYEFNATCFQMGILLLFNKPDENGPLRLTEKEIATQTSLEGRLFSSKIDSNSHTINPNPNSTSTNNIAPINPYSNRLCFLTLSTSR